MGYIATRLPLSPKNRLYKDTNKAIYKVSIMVPSMVFQGTLRDSSMVILG